MRNGIHRIFFVWCCLALFSLSTGEALGAIVIRVNGQYEQSSTSGILFTDCVFQFVNTDEPHIYKFSYKTGKAQKVYNTGGISGSMPPAVYIGDSIYGQNLGAGLGLIPGNTYEIYGAYYGGYGYFKTLQPIGQFTYSADVQDDVSVEQGTSTGGDWGSGQFGDSWYDYSPNAFESGTGETFADSDIYQDMLQKQLEAAVKRPSTKIVGDGNGGYTVYQWSNEMGGYVPVEQTIVDSAGNSVSDVVSYNDSTEALSSTVLSGIEVASRTQSNYEEKKLDALAELSIKAKESGNLLAEMLAEMKK